jgi:dTDP-4-amino-4,6-dideoxygalactose transaminase
MKKKYDQEKIPFNLPHLTGKELDYISQAHLYGALAGDGPFTKRCHSLLETYSKCKKALLTHSCTAALEMAALLIDIQPGDEIIMPSYTFVSTANAFVLRGGVPVFVDIREDTLNLDEQLIEAAITPRTRAISPVHYAGISCEMDYIMKIANHYGVRVIEDAAQGVMASYKGRSLGSIGDLGAYSFHETKNLISGEGGALIVNDPELIIKAEIIREKGTDRSRFFRGDIDKYTWQEPGSSFLPGELTAAFLWAQLQEAQEITNKRLYAWSYYDELLKGRNIDHKLRRPFIPKECKHNGHMYYIVLSHGIDRSSVLEKLNNSGVNAIFHYVPLHSSPGGLRYGRVHGDMINTVHNSNQLIRLPIWYGITKEQQERVVDELYRALN